MPTHTGGGTIDLVYTKSDDNVYEMLVDPPGAISDHSLIHWRLPVVTQPIIVAPREYRKCKSLDYDKLRCALLESELCDVNNRPRSAEEYFDRYERVLRSLVHDHVPVTRLG